MTKVASNNSPINYRSNFILRGVNSIQIGIYLLIFAYVTKTILEGFISDSSPLLLLSIELVEYQILSLGILFVLFSYFALFYSSRRICRKESLVFWNASTKATFWVSFFLSIVVISVLYYLNTQGFYLQLTAIFLLLYGIYLLLYNFRKKRSLYIMGGLFLMLALLTFIIPTYWYNALLIAGVGHIVYGLMVKK